MLRLALLSLAVVAAAGAGWLALSRLSDAPPEPEAIATLSTSEVLVATTGIARGATLGPANLAWREWPEQAVAPDMIKRANAPGAIETYTGWISRDELAVGHPVRIGLIAEDEAGLMSLALTPGMRAVAVETSAESSAGGFILPDDRVDVIHTMQEDVDGDGEEEPVSLTIIHNVRVLAIDQTAEPEDGETAKVGDTVTLELTPLQVELLTTARNSGRISLALRSVTDFGENEMGDLAMVPGLPMMLGPEDGLAEAAMADAFGSAEPATAPVSAEDVEEEPAEEEAATDEPAEVEVRVIGSGTLETVLVEPAWDAALRADAVEWRAP